MKIEELHFSVRTYNCLKREGIHTVEQLKKLSDDDLMSIRCFGVACLAEVRRQIEKPLPTNADRIRAMSDRELADFLSTKFANQAEIDAAGKGLPLTATYLSELKHTWYVAWMQWLQQPAEDCGHGET